MLTSCSLMLFRSCSSPSSCCGSLDFGDLGRDIVALQANASSGCLLGVSPVTENLTENGTVIVLYAILLKRFCRCSSSSRSNSSRCTSFAAGSQLAANLGDLRSRRSCVDFALGRFWTQPALLITLNLVCLDFKLRAKCSFDFAR